MCGIDNETGKETVEEIKEIFNAEVLKIDSCAPVGSKALLLTKENGLFIKMKNLNGEWIDI